MESTVYNWITVNTDTMLVKCDRCYCYEDIPEISSMDAGWAQISAFRDIHKFCKETGFNQ